MTEAEAIAYVRGAAEDDGPETYEDAAELFAAIFGRAAEPIDGDQGELWSLCCAAVQDGDLIGPPPGWVDRAVDRARRAGVLPPESAAPK